MAKQRPRYRQTFWCVQEEFGELSFEHTKFRKINSQSLAVTVTWRVLEWPEGFHFAKNHPAQLIGAQVSVYSVHYGFEMSRVRKDLRRTVLS